MQSKEELVNLATFNFQNKNYEECINNLNELLKTNVDDPKILHNLAVAKYYYKQEKKQKEALNDLLQKTLQENKNVIDENKLDIIELLKDESDPFNNFKLNNYLNNQKEKENDTENDTPSQEDNEKSIDKESLNEPDLDLAENQDDTELDPSKLSNLPALLSDISYELYNTAIIYYKEKKFNEAIELLESTFSNVEALDDYIALKICFLLIDLYLEINDTKKALAALEISQKIYNRSIEEIKCIENEDGDSSINSLKDIDQSSSKSDLDKSDKGQNETNENLLSSSSISSLKNLTNNSPDINSALPSKFNTFNSFYYYQKCKINIKNKEMEEAKKNMELSLRSNKIDSIINDHSVDDDTMVAADFMNANEIDNNKNKKMDNSQENLNYYQLENVINNLNATFAYNKNDINESFKLLNSQTHGEDYIYNNLGCISYREKKYTLAENYFLKALKENEELIKKSQNISESNDLDNQKEIQKLPSILHNLELQYMIHNDFEMAINCLIHDRRIDKEDTITIENIFYWLRAGENFLRKYKDKAYSMDPKNTMKVYRISPEIAYGFINNKSRSYSLLGDNSEFEELNK
eukprot:jgi/Orpsp1_1/1176095/evm.model.c7180000056379.1